jgi:hypothetical protein
MRATLVGGGAIEFYAPGSYATTDIDLVVELGTREKLAGVFESLGLTRKDRHWVLDDVFVEVPGTWQSDPVEEFPIGPFTLRVVRKEIVLADRIVGFRYWKYWAYGLQAIDMMNSFGAELDVEALRHALRREQAEDAYELLASLGASGEPMTLERLDREWHARYR